MSKCNNSGALAGCLFYETVGERGRCEGLPQAIAERSKPAEKRTLSSFDHVQLLIMSLWPCCNVCKKKKIMKLIEWVAKIKERKTTVSNHFTQSTAKRNETKPKRNRNEIETENEHNAPSFDLLSVFPSACRLDHKHGFSRHQLGWPDKRK